jgi:hypothetical protein
MEKNEMNATFLISMTPWRPLRRWLSAALTSVGLLAPNPPACAEEATPLESIQILSGNYRRGGNVGAIGHLGGVPVSIPKEFAKFLEYDGDPGFLEKRKEPAPKRTFESGICSFGFDIRYPDMMPVNAQTWEEKRKAHRYTTMWVHVGVRSNSAYQDRSKARMAISAKALLKSEALLYHHEKQQEKVHGLTAYIPTKVDLSRREMGSNLDRNVYFHYLKNGDVDAYIACSNRNHEAAPCSHRFDLAPELKVSVDVSYRKGMLPYWREIQDGVSKVLLGFRVDAPKAPSAQPHSSPSSLPQTQE